METRLSHIWANFVHLPPICFVSYSYEQNNKKLNFYLYFTFNFWYFPACKFL